MRTKSLLNETRPDVGCSFKEGITPKLVWTKRTGNGDTLTAQEWLEGRLLTPNEIGQRNDVIDVLYHLHHSNSLKTILTRIGGRVMTPEKMLQKYEKNYRKNSRKSISANCPSFSS